ncbi:MAG: translation elongation factor-like protein [Candidatus Aenigmatarchaeota archaeon]|nr:translation elongation factor-like protein [Candidatus Aenigmarchaeota archaeon]
MKLVGKVTHFYPKISVAVVEVLDEIKVGDEILIKGKTTNFKQIVESMQIEHEQVEKASKGDSVGLKVVERVREGDEVFKIE